MSTLLALYGQLFERNLEFDPLMQGNEFEIDLPNLLTATALPREKIDQRLAVLRKHGFVSSTRGPAALLDPTTNGWPPRPFAMLPVRYLIKVLPELRKAATQKEVKSRDALALYIVLVVQRNHVTEEVWFSREKSPLMAGLEPKLAVKCLGVLMQSRLIVRTGLSTFKFLLLGFEATDRPAR